MKLRFIITIWNLRRFWTLMRDSQGEIRDHEKSNMQISFMAFEIKKYSFFLWKEDVWACMVLYDQLTWLVVGVYFTFFKFIRCVRMHLTTSYELWFWLNCFQHRFWLGYRRSGYRVLDTWILISLIQYSTQTQL